VSRVFYRIIQGPEPTLEDFIPLKVLGRPLRNPRWKREWESAISVFDDLDYTIGKARQHPKIGTHIAKLEIPDDGSIEVAKTMDDPHHYSIYAPAEQIIELVVGLPLPKELIDG
jgi:hypothetical protein